MQLTALAQRWIEDARAHRDLAQEPLARLKEKCAQELLEALEEHGDELLTLQEAADETSLTPGHLGRLVRQGKIPQSGRTHAPRIARRDLPVRANTFAKTPNGHEISRTQIVRSVIDRGV